MSSASAQQGGIAGPWALVDARSDDLAEVVATTRIAGLPQVCRLLRMAARQQWSGALVLVTASTRAAVTSAIARFPPPAGFVVELADSQPTDRRWIALDGRALYHASALAEAAGAETTAVPFATMRTRADIGSAERLLYRSLRKNIEFDGVVAYFVLRPISEQMTRVLVNTRVTPNQVTIVAMLFGIAAGVLAGFGTHAAFAAAGIAFWVGAIVDCVDGEIARLRLESSSSGEWLDTIADDVATNGLIAGLGVGLASRGVEWLWLGVASATVGLAIKVVMYWDLHRLGRPIDTAKYPWFFGDPNRPREQRSQGAVGTAWYYLEFLGRRDAYCTAAMLLLLVPMPRIVFAGLAFLSVAAGPLLLIHFVVLRVRRRKSA